MVFSSMVFLFRFLPLVLILYFGAPAKWRNLILFLTSLFFYAWGEPVYVVLMLFSTAVDFVHGAQVERCLQEGNRKKAGLFVCSSAVINLGLLGFFKYADFVIGNVNALSGLSIPLLHLPLPVGISFYTFQTMSYTIDVYRGQAKAQKDWISFGAYVALFPQLIAGPIVQYKTVAEQLVDRTHSLEQFSCGVVRFVTGLAKKVLLANQIGLLWESVSATSPEQLPVLTAWLGIVAFAFQIYFDFSGYSDMAIGLGKMFGFTFLENFDYPYLSGSITEFWRRWHISLGTWFREYVYIPLGGNRKGRLLKMRNLLLVWCLTGIWHGASWNFLLWGLYFAVFLILEKAFLLDWLKRLPGVLCHMYTLLLVLVSWVLFAFEDLGRAGAYFRSMLGMQAAGFVNGNSCYLLLSYGVLLLILCVACTDYPKKGAAVLQRRLSACPLVWEGLKNGFLAVLFLLSLAYLVDASYNPFLYFRF